MEESSSTLNVLCLEDVLKDAEVITENLIDAGYLVSVDIVAEEKEYVSFLNSRNYDIILADYTLPGFDALTALKLARELQPEAPFICVSGTIGEERAVELLKLGATDYVIKDRLGRLAFAVRRALEGAAKQKEWKKAEEALRESEENLKEAQRLSQIGSWQWTVDTDTVKWSEELYHINGRNPNLSPPCFAEMSSCYTPESWKRLSTLVEEALQSGESYESELEIVRPDSTTRHTFAHGKTDYDADGKIVGLHGTVQDISERKRADEELIKLKKAIYTSGEAIFLTDQEGVFTFVNPAFSSLYGFSSDEVIGKATPRIIKSEALDKSVYEVFWQTLMNGDEVRRELINKRKDGTLINIESSATPVMDENKNIIGFLGIQRNINERKRAEEELIIAKEHAEESDRLKSAFLANMSHEIRTPMNGILGFAELLKEPNLKCEDQHKYIKIIEKSGVRMLNIINDIVDISKIESGLMEVNLKESNINEQIEYIYTFFKQEVEGKGMQLFFKNSLPAKEAIIITDPEKLYAILTNLVKNAIKYSEKGSIEFGYDLVEMHGRAFIQFFVKDTGTGIPRTDKQQYLNVLFRLILPTNMLIRELAWDYLFRNLMWKCLEGKSG